MIDEVFVGCKARWAIIAAMVARGIFQVRCALGFHGMLLGSSESPLVSGEALRRVELSPTNRASKYVGRGGVGRQIRMPLPTCHR